MNGPIEQNSKIIAEPTPPSQCWRAADAIRLPPKQHDRWHQAHAASGCHKSFASAHKGAKFNINRSKFYASPHWGRPNLHAKLHSCLFLTRVCKPQLLYIFKYYCNILELNQGAKYFNNILNRVGIFWHRTLDICKLLYLWNTHNNHITIKSAIHENRYKKTEHYISEEDMPYDEYMLGV